MTMFAALFGLVSMAFIITAAIVLVVVGVLTGAVSSLVASMGTVGRWVRRPAPGARGSLVGFALGFFRAGTIAAVATVAVLSVRALAADAPRPDDPCMAPVVLEAGVVTDVDEAAVWAAEDAAWTAAMTAALASLPDDEPGPLTDELVEAFTLAKIADIQRQRELEAGHEPVAEGCPPAPPGPVDVG